MPRLFARFGIFFACSNKIKSKCCMAEESMNDFYTVILNHRRIISVVDFYLAIHQIRKWDIHCHAE